MSYSEENRHDGGTVAAAPASRSRVHAGIRNSLATIAWAAASAIGAAVLAPSAALAGYTVIAPPPAGEQSQQQIFNHIYGGTFTQAGYDFVSTNGTVAHRIQDYLDPSRGINADPLPLFMQEDELNVTAGGPQNFTDQTWLADNVTAVARARFATFSNEFGYLEGTSGLAFNKLFWTSGGGYDVGGNNTLNRFATSLFRWGRDGDQGPLSSQPSDNSDLSDHMITYQISRNQSAGVPGGISTTTTYLLFWEDTKAPTNVLPPHYDADYNDMVVEIQATSTLVPEPATLGTLAAMGTLGLARRRRTR